MEWKLEEEEFTFEKVVTNDRRAKLLKLAAKVVLSIFSNALYSA